MGKSSGEGGGELYGAIIGPDIRESESVWLARSSWTRELLVRQLAKETGVLCHASHIGRLLGQLAIRWGRPKAVSKASAQTHGKSAKVGKLKALAATLAADGVVVYRDEVDIHLTRRLVLAGCREGSNFR